MHSVLLAVQDRDLHGLMKLVLADPRFSVTDTLHERHILTKVSDKELELVVLGLNQLEQTLDLMKKIKAVRDVPVTLVSTESVTRDIVRGLESGADDFLVPPFDLKELRAKIVAVLGRARLINEDIVRSGDLEINLKEKSVHSGGEQIELSRTEWLLLQYLVIDADKVVTNAELLTKVWGPEYNDELAYIRVWISRLRRKIEKDYDNPLFIVNHSGQGYRFAILETK